MASTFDRTVGKIVLKHANSSSKSQEYERLWSLKRLSFKDTMGIFGILITRACLEIISVEPFYRSYLDTSRPKSLWCHWCQWVIEVLPNLEIIQVILVVKTYITQRVMGHWCFQWYIKEKPESLANTWECQSSCRQLLRKWCIKLLGWIPSCRGNLREIKVWWIRTIWHGKP